MSYLGHFSKEPQLKKNAKETSLQLSFLSKLKQKFITYRSLSGNSTSASGNSDGIFSCDTSHEIWALQKYFK